LIAGSIGLLVLLGCGRGQSEYGQEVRPTTGATGFVKYKGAPVANAAVGFYSIDEKIRSFGVTDGVGSFTLSTYGDKDGIPAGKYRVTVAMAAAREVEPGVLEDEPTGGFKSSIPLKYNSPKTTDILVEVKDGQANEFNIDLK
jgi:hypothetical protein